MIRNFFKYLYAEFSHAFKGAASKKISSQRLQECMQCDQRKVELLGSLDPAGVGYCGACGCLPSARSLLQVKVGMAKATCPLNKWMQTGGTGATARTILEAVLGFVTTAKTYVPKFPKRALTEKKVKKNAIKRVSQMRKELGLPPLDLKKTKVTITVGTASMQPKQNKIG